jgi:hypothetical protein
MLPDATELRRLIAFMPTIDLRAYCIFLAVLGWRPMKVLRMTSRHIHSAGDPPVVHYPGSMKVTSSDYDTYLSDAAFRAYKTYMAWKHRERRIMVSNSSGRYTGYRFTPQVRTDDLIFAPYKRNPQTIDRNYLGNLSQCYRKKLDMHLYVQGYKMDAVTKRYPISFGTFRLSTHATLAKYGLKRYANHYIREKKWGFWRLPEEERIKMFREAEKWLA